MERRALDDGTAQQHGVEVGDRGDDTSAAHLKGNILQFGAFALGSELIGYGPTGRLGGGAQVELLAQGVDFEHQTVGGDRQLFPLNVPVVDKVFHGIDAGQNGHLTRLESPALERHDAVVVGCEGQVVTQHEIEDGIQPATCHLGTVLQLERTGGSIAGIGKQRLFVELTLGIELLKTLPGQQDFTSHLKFVGQIVHASDFQWHALDGDDIGGHIVALHAVAACHGSHQSPFLIGHRYRRAVIFHLAHNLAGLPAQAVLGAAQEILHFLDAVAVGQRHHGTFVAHLDKPFGNIAAHALGGRERIHILGVIVLQFLQFAQQGVELLVAYRWGIQHIIIVVMAVDDFPQLFDSLFK